MPGFEVWDIVKVPFPYIDRPVRQSRPALVIAAVETRHDLLWVAMITSAANRGWEGDVPISDLQGAGLPVPSLVRPAKLTTIEARDAARLGTLAPQDRGAVSLYLRDRLRAALAAPRRA